MIIVVILDVAAAIIGILFWAERRSLATPIRPSGKENRNLRTSGPRHQRQTAMTNRRLVPMPTENRRREVPPRACRGHRAVRPESLALLRIPDRHRGGDVVLD